MARPKGSRNKKTIDRENASAASGGIGHNSGNVGDLDETQRKSLHHRHVQEYERVEKALKTAQSAFKAACNIIKAEGDSVADVKKTIEIRANPDLAEKTIAGEIERLLRLSRWNALAVGSQANLFVGDVRPLAERAKEEGIIVGMRGEVCTPPYDEAEASQQWIAGWHEGQATLASRIKSTDSGLIRGEANRSKGPDEFDGETAAEGASGEPWPDDVEAANRANGDAGEGAPAL